MPVCPKCGAGVPLKLAIQSTDALMFPAEPRKRCPQCQAALVPTTASVLTGIALFIILAAIAVLALQLGLRGGFVPGFLGGMIAGLAIALGGTYLGATVLRFRD